MYCIGIYDFFDACGRSVRAYQKVIRLLDSSDFAETPALTIQRIARQGNTVDPLSWSRMAGG